MIKTLALLLALMAGSVLLTSCTSRDVQQGVRIGKNAQLSAVLQFIDESECGVVIWLEFDPATRDFEITTLIGEELGLLSGHGYKLRLRVEGEGANRRVVILEKGKWMS